MIIRARKRESFTMISNMPIGDERLSAESLGVLTYLLSFSDNWRLTHKDLMRRFHIGRDKTYNIIRELRAAGYLVKELQRDQLGHVIDHELVICEEPQSFKRVRSARKTLLPEKPEYGKHGALLKTKDYSRLSVVQEKDDSFDDFETYPGPERMQ